MTRSCGLMLVALGVLASCGAELGAADASDVTGGPPNLLVVYCDDLRFDGAASLGSAFLPTPHLDRLAGEGAVFPRSYATTSRCAPSRASFLTGTRASTHGVWVNRPTHDWRAGLPFLPDALRQQGYATAWIGKWHLPNPGARPVPGLDHFASYEGPGSHFDQEFVVDGEPRATQGFQAEALTELALEFVERQESPWFLVVSHKAPHVPLTPAPDQRGALDGVEVPLPASASDPLEALPPRYRLAREGESGRHGVGDLDSWRAEVQAYWELVLGVDAAVGRLLESLERDGELEDTVVLLTSDNGQLLGEHGLRQKGLAYEPAIRVPLVVWGPGRVVPGRREGTLALNLDLAPTLLGLAGARAPEAMEGLDLGPALLDPGRVLRERFLYQAPALGGEAGLVERAVVERRWKYIAFETPQGRDEALFDLEQDPGERVDLSSEPTLEAERARLAAWLAAERARLGDA